MLLYAVWRMLVPKGIYINYGLLYGLTLYLAMGYRKIKVKELNDGVVLITLNRPKKLNTMSAELSDELCSVLEKLDQDHEKYGCVVITGNPKVFCAGADISELRKGLSEDKNIISWSVRLPAIKIPMIAAVDGFCLGGGCELAMMCDIIYSTKRAIFGQPEIKIGILPGGGGTQRLPKAIGKSAAMELILTGNQFSAEKAFEMGLVSHLFDSHESLMKGAIKTALQISRGPRTAVKAAKACVAASYNLGEKAGLEFERNEFLKLLDTDDKKEGMAAFFQRREPKFAWRQSKL